MTIASPALLLATLLSTGTPAAQETHPPQPQITSAPAEARFAVLQSESWDTYRLDKLTGEVWRLRQATSRFSGERQVWHSIPPPPDDERLQPAGVNYQLSTSRVEGTLLLNVHTGASWILRTISGEPRWVPLTVEK